MADIPVTTPSPWIRTRAEGAILEAKGDIHGALDKLAEVEAAIAIVPNKASATSACNCYSGSGLTYAVVAVEPMEHLQNESLNKYVSVYVPVLEKR